MGLSLRQGVLMNKRKPEAKWKQQARGKNKKGKIRSKKSPSPPPTPAPASLSLPSPKPASPPPSLPRPTPASFPAPTPASTRPGVPLTNLPMPYSEFPLHNEISDRFPELGLDFIPTVIMLISNGTITDPDKLLRGQKSGNQSWDTGRRSVIIPFEELMCSICTYDDPSRKENVKQRVEQYLESARTSEYFDADPMARPKEIPEGLYVLYPGGLKDQKDPIFETGSQLMKYQSYIERLAMAAVEYHNYLTDSGIKFSAVKKANVFFDLWFQAYFITLEVFDSKGEKLTCKSRIECHVDTDDDFPFHGKSVIDESFVESFKFVN